MIIIISSIFGFVYETIFYRFDLGYFIKRGQGLGPWLPIYGVGGFIITLFAYKYKNKTFQVFLISALICGMLEFITGYLLFNILGIRLWDYNIEILNYGNIGGYICLRSILFFGISGVFLIKIVLPIINKIYNSWSKKIINTITIIISSIYFIDIIINYIILNLI